MRLPGRRADLPIEAARRLVEAGVGGKRIDDRPPLGIKPQRCEQFVRLGFHRQRFAALDMAFEQQVKTKARDREREKHRRGSARQQPQPQRTHRHQPSSERT